MNEALTADSSRMVSRAKRGQGARAAGEDVCGLGKIQTSAFGAAKAQFDGENGKATRGGEVWGFIGAWHVD